MSSATPTISLFLPGFLNLPASIQGDLWSQSGAINYYTLACANGIGDQCPFNTNWILTEGPSTVTWSQQPQATETTTVACEITDSTRAVCAAMTVASGSTMSASYTTSPTYVPVTLTEVADGLVVPGAATASASTNATPTSVQSGSRSGGATGASSSTTSGKAAKSLATGVLGLSGAMAVFAAVAGAV